MSLIVLTSAGHAPGVTTTALGLVLNWPAPALLVDADRVPTQSVLAGYLRGEDPSGKGLWEVLAAYRDRRSLSEAIDRASLELATTEVRRQFLPGFANPGMGELFGTAWPEFAGVLAAREGGVVVDAGTIGVHGLPPALTAAADQVVVVTGSSLVDLAALRLYLPLVAGGVAAERLSLMVVGAGRPYSASEIGAQFGVALPESIDWAPGDAAALSHGVPTRRGSAGAYSRSLTRAAAALVGKVESLRTRIGAPR